jgi:prepilin-type N-terminal cleavage/methylation domain-containing protein
MRSPITRAEGFTLIEILIAIVILSLLMLGVYSMIDNSSLTQENVTKEDRQYLQVETALNRMESDFANFYTPLFFTSRYNPLEERQSSGAFGDDGRDDFDNKPANEQTALRLFRPTERFPGITRKGIPIPVVLNEAKDELGFMTSLNKRRMANAKQSRFAWVRYSLRNSEKREDDERKERGEYELVRQYSADNPFMIDFDWDEVKAHTLLKDVASLSFHYWDSQKRRWVDSIREINADPNLIRIIKVKLSYVDRMGNREDLERILRSQWPLFDTVQDDANYEKAKRPVENPRGENNNSNNTNNNGILGE